MVVQCTRSASKRFQQELEKPDPRLWVWWSLTWVLSSSPPSHTTNGWLPEALWRVRSDGETRKNAKTSRMRSGSWGAAALLLLSAFTGRAGGESPGFQYSDDAGPAPAPAPFPPFPDFKDLAKHLRVAPSPDAGPGPAPGPAPAATPIGDITVVQDLFSGRLAPPDVYQTAPVPAPGPAREHRIVITTPSVTLPKSQGVPPLSPKSAPNPVRAGVTDSECVSRIVFLIAAVEPRLFTGLRELFPPVPGVLALFTTWHIFDTV